VTKSKTTVSAKAPTKPLKCPYCDRVFPKSQCLGGHVSKSHPNASEKYQHKKMVRESRTCKRDMLKVAKKMLIQHDPTLNISQNRYKVYKMCQTIKKIQEKDNEISNYTAAQ